MQHGTSTNACNGGEVRTNKGSHASFIATPSVLMKLAGIQGVIVFLNCLPIVLNTQFNEP